MSLAVQAQERRRDLSQTINALEEQRQITLRAYHSMTSLRDSKQNAGELTEVSTTNLQDFLTQMVDYIAMGHMTVYQRIIDGTERRINVSVTAQRVYPSIGETTDAMVEFYEKYEYFDGDMSADNSLDGDISLLGETLSIRGELEDELLRALTK